jgi:hypothetical protein
MTWMASVVKKGLAVGRAKEMAQKIMEVKGER